MKCIIFIFFLTLSKYVIFWKIVSIEHYFKFLFLVLRLQKLLATKEFENKKWGVSVLPQKFLFLLLMPNCKIFIQFYSAIFVLLSVIPQVKRNLLVVRKLLPYYPIIFPKLLVVPEKAP